MRYPVLILSVALSWLSSAETTVFRGFTLIDGTGKGPQPDSAMIVTDGRIRWVGPAARLKIPAGAETVDCSGKFIVPGIINLHGHLGNVVGLVQDPKNFTRQNVEAQLATYARYGVTSVLSMGSDQPLIFDLRAEQRAGRPKLTRIFTAGRGFTGPGGYPTTAPGMKGVPYEVATVEDVKKALAELAPKKPDILKIWVDDHLGKEVKIPLEISTAIIQEGRKLGLRTAAHIFYYEDAKALAERGLYATAHSVRDKPVDQALINAMKKSGTWQLGTLVRELSVFVFSEPPDFLKDPFFTMSVAPEVIQTIDSPAYRKRLQSDPDVPKYRGFLKTAQQNLKTLYDAGVKVGFATDSGPPARFSGFFEHKEMELMTEAGFRPLEIITIFSKNSAEFLRMSKDLGTVEPGHWADFIILTKNPADDIKNMRAIDAVYIAGNRVR